MIEQSLKSKTEKISAENVQVVYNLIFKDALYSFECYIEGSENNKNYSYLENITEDEGEAEFFLGLMAKGKVHPVHMKDIAQDYFGVVK